MVLPHMACPPPPPLLLPGRWFTTLSFAPPDTPTPLTVPIESPMLFVRFWLVQTALGRARRYGTEAEVEIESRKEMDALDTTFCSRNITLVKFVERVDKEHSLVFWWFRIIDPPVLLVLLLVRLTLSLIVLPCCYWLCYCYSCWDGGWRQGRWSAWLGCCSAPVRLGTWGWIGCICVGLLVGLRV